MNAPNRRHCLVLIVLAALASASAGQAQVYKCVVKGATVYQDSSCGSARPAASVGTGAASAATVSTRQAAAPTTPEFAPGTVLEPPVIRTRTQAPAASARATQTPAASSAKAVAQAPYIARAPRRDSSSARDALTRALAEERALFDQERGELDQLTAQWRSQGGNNTMQADMEAHRRRWDWRHEAARAKVEAASQAVSSACPAGMSRRGGDCR